MSPTSHQAADEHILDALLADTAPALLVISAAGCPVCATAANTLGRLAAEYADRARIIFIEADKAPGLLRRTGLGRLPGLVFVRDGRELARLAGLPPEQGLRSWLDYTVHGGVQPPVPHGPSAPLRLPATDRRAASVGYGDDF